MSTTPDDPTLDATDFAHPAWWRGEEHGVNSMCRLVHKWLDEPIDTKGTHYPNVQAVKDAIYALRARRDSAEENARDLAKLLDNERARCEELERELLVEREASGGLLKQLAAHVAELADAGEALARAASNHYFDEDHHACSACQWWMDEEHEPDCPVGRALAAPLMQAALKARREQEGGAK